MSRNKNYIIVIASEFKGNDFIEECSEAGWHVTLVTRENLLDEAWVWTSIDAVKSVSPGASHEDYVRAVANTAGNQPVNRIVGIDEFDVLTAAKAREHFRLEGMSMSDALIFRDKLAMRVAAEKAGIPCPEFTGIFNGDDINRFLSETVAPWVIKPRFEVSAFGIKKCETADSVWDSIRILDERNTWRDHPSQFLIERFVKGNVFHVDSVVRDGKIIAAGFSRYTKPPMQVSHEGGIFATSILPYNSKEKRELERFNKKLLKAFNYNRGVTHAEFLQCAETGKYYLLEVAARVGGAYIANVLEEACGFNLWREWAKLEIETKENPYKSPKIRKDFAGVTLCLSNQISPDTSSYTDEEIVYRVSKPNHAGLIFYSQNYERIGELMEIYTERLSQDFLSIVPTKERHDS